MHTYYPCGAFSFSRQVESEGWVAQLKDCGGYLEDRLVFVNLPHTPQFNYNGCIGVLLKRLHSVGGGGNSSDAHPERVLVLQNLYGYEPPRAWPPLPQLPAAGISLNQNDASVMASTMVARRLQPADLLQRLLRFCEARDSSGSLVQREAEAVAMQSMHATAPGSPLLHALLADPSQFE